MNKSIQLIGKRDLGMTNYNKQPEVSMSHPVGNPRRQKLKQIPYAASFFFQTDLAKRLNFLSANPEYEIANVSLPAGSYLNCLKILDVAPAIFEGLHGATKRRPQGHPASRSFQQLWPPIN